MARTPAHDLQEEFMTTIRRGQDGVVDAIKTWVETVQSITPRLSSVYAPLTDKLPKLPPMPFADRLPTPHDVVTSGYEFAEQLLATQRKFAEDVLAVAAPLVPGNGKHSSSSTWGTATRPEPKAADIVPAPKATVVAPEPKTTAVVPAPTAPVARSVAKPVTEAAPKVPAPAPAPKPATPKPAASASPAPAAPKPAAPKPAASAPSHVASAPAPKAPEARPSAATATAPKHAPAKESTPKDSAPKDSAPKSTASKAAAPKTAAPKAATPKAAPKPRAARTTKPAASRTAKPTAPQRTPKSPDAQ